MLPIHRRQKIFGLPTSYGIDRNAKARLIFYVRAWSRRHKLPGQHHGPITRAFLDVLKAMMDFANGKTGSCFPSYEAIAGKAECSRSTVALAIPALEFCGAIRVVNRLKRRGPCVLRTSNAYIFRDVAPSSENRPRTTSLKESVTPIQPSLPKVIFIEPVTELDRTLARLQKLIDPQPQPG